MNFILVLNLIGLCLFYGDFDGVTGISITDDLQLTTKPYHPIILRNIAAGLDNKVSSTQIQEKHKEAENKLNKNQNHQNIFKHQVKGGSTTHNVEHGKKGTDVVENHKKSYDEGGGKKHTNNDEDNHAHQHHEHLAGGAKHKYKSQNKDNKRRSEKGYHSKYHKHETHKLDQYFKNFHEDGEYQKFAKGLHKHHNDQSKGEKGHHTAKGEESKHEKKKT